VRTPAATPTPPTVGGARTFEGQWRERFERFARSYDDEALISGWSDAGLRRRVELFWSLLPALGLPARATALDLGCGGGTYVRLLAGAGHRALGLDYSLPSLGRARAADPGGRGRYLSGEAYALPFASASFDLVVSIGVLQALTAPDRALGEMARVARPGGVVLVEALNGLGAVALLRRAVERLRGRPARVRTYAPPRVRRWLAAAGLTLETEAGLCLPPRRMPGLARVLDSRPVGALLNTVPGLIDAAAHSFLFVARKPSAAGRGPSPVRARVGQ